MDFVNNTHELINKGNYKNLNKNPTAKFQRQIKTALNNATSLIDDKISNPQASQHNSFIILHKSGYSSRSVISYVTAPATKVSKLLILDVVNLFPSIPTEKYTKTRR